MDGVTRSIVFLNSSPRHQLLVRQRLQFETTPASTNTCSQLAAGANKSAKREFRQILASSKTYTDLSECIGGIEGGEQVLKEVEQTLEARERAVDASRFREVVQAETPTTNSVEPLEVKPTSPRIPPAPALQLETEAVSLVSV